MPRPQIVVQFGAITLSTSPISKLRAANDERRQVKRTGLANRLTVEAKALADLKIEKAAVKGERRTVEADLGPVLLGWFILVVALLLDPAAVLLLLAATRAPPRRALAPRSKSDYVEL